MNESTKGQNRHERRASAARDRGAQARLKKNRMKNHLYNGKISHREAVLKKQEATHVRALLRKKTKKAEVKGILQIHTDLKGSRGSSE